MLFTVPWYAAVYLRKRAGERESEREREREGESKRDSSKKEGKGGVRRPRSEKKDDSKDRKSKS